MLHDAVQTKTKLMFYTRNDVKPGSFTLAYQQNAHIWCLKIFKIEIHAKLKNKLFDQGHHV